MNENIKGFFKRGDEVMDEAITAVFPIIRMFGDEYKFYATGFFISAGGMFCTAKHVICDPEGSPDDHLYAVYFHMNNGCEFRAITQVINVSGSDICIGLIQDMHWTDTNELVKNHVMKISSVPLKVGDMVAAYAYPNSSVIRKDREQIIFDFNTSWSFGETTQEFQGRDKHMLPGHSFETNMHIKGGASGAPVANADGKIVGVVSTSIDFSDDGPPVSYITPITEIFDMKVNFGEKTYTISELGEMNLISIYP